MRSQRSAKAIYVDRKRGLVIPDGTPQVIARLARELHRFGDVERHDDAPTATQTFLVWNELPTSTCKQISWTEIAQMNFGQMVDEAIQSVLRDDTDAWSRFPIQYGLYQLNRALTEELSANEVMEAIAWAGCCVGVVAFANGLRQAPGEVANQRWKEFNKIKAEVRERYQREREDCGSKEQFIRRHRDEVLARSKALEGPLKDSSVNSRMRKWLTGL